MYTFEHFLLYFCQGHQLLAYAIIFLGMFIEGEAVLILSGILVKGHTLHFFDTLIVAFVAVVLHDILYWQIGKILSRKKVKKFLFLNLEKFHPFQESSQAMNGVYIFISKFAWNLNRLALISRGYLNISLKHLIKYSIPAAFLWSVTFISLGYMFAEQTDLLKHDLKTVIIFVTGFLVLVIALESLMRKNFKKNI